MSCCSQTDHGVRSRDTGGKIRLCGMPPGRYNTPFKTRGLLVLFLLVISPTPGISRAARPGRPGAGILPDRRFSGCKGNPGSFL